MNESNPDAVNQSVSTVDTTFSTPIEKPKFFKIDNSVIVLLVLMVVLIISILSLINYQRGIVLSYNADSIIAALPTRPPKKVLATPAIDPYADWKIYENAEHGFSFKYPSDLNIISDPNRDGKIIALVTDDTRATVDASGWKGIFINVLSNPSNHDSKTFVQWVVKSDPLNAGVTIKKIPITGYDVSITQGEVVGGNSEPLPRIYIAKGSSIIQLSPNYYTYSDIQNKIASTITFL